MALGDGPVAVANAFEEEPLPRPDDTAPELGCGDIRKLSPSDRGQSAVTTDVPDSEVEEEETESDSEYVHRYSAEETVLIFDWDDTILPSSWVQEQGLRLDPDFWLSPWQKEELAELARLAARTLRLAKSLGTVVLVTNAERGWIELSCQKFLPSLLPLLESVKLLSARSTYETPELSSPFEWKLRAFESEINRIYSSDTYSQRQKNILSLGDSVHERDAVIQATANLPSCRTKSLKFIERPGIEELRRQHALIARCLRRVVHHEGNLDLVIRVS